MDHMVVADPKARWSQSVSTARHATSQADRRRSRSGSARNCDRRGSSPGGGYRTFTRSPSEYETVGKGLPGRSRRAIDTWSPELFLESRLTQPAPETG